MTRRPRYEELTDGARRRLITMSLLRSAATVTLMVAVYYLAPLDGPLDSASLILLGVGLLALVPAVAWEVRAIIAAEMPRLRAIQTVAVGLPLLLLLFASAYVVIAGAEPGSFTQELGHTDALYFTVTVFSTVGFGDIAPVREVARIVTTLQMVMGLVAVGVIARIVLSAAQMGVQRRDSAAADGAPAPGAAARDGDAGSD